MELIFPKRFDPTTRVPPQCKKVSLTLGEYKTIKEIEKDWNKQILDKRYKIKRSELLNNFYFKDIEKRDILNNEIEDLNIKIEQISKIKDKIEIQNLLKIDLSNNIMLTYLTFGNYFDQDIFIPDSVTYLRYPTRSH